MEGVVGKKSRTRSPECEMFSPENEEFGYGIWREVK